VNCIILGRAEAYGSKYPPLKTLVNSLGMGVGFTMALLAVGGVREILGFGSFFGIPLFGSSFQPWAVFILPPGGFIVLSLWLFLFAWIKQRKEKVHAA
jgi:Na+-translocating ferredoxin:NAD+ oxidoreductase subunit E